MFGFILRNITIRVMFEFKFIGGALLPDELEMRNLIEISLTKNNVQEKIYNGNGINVNQQQLDKERTNIETHQDLSQQHYESNCGEKSKRTPV